MNKVLLYLLYLLFVVALFLAASEWLLRSKGVTPWQPKEIHIQVDPGGKFFALHPTLGYSHLPGKFSVTLNPEFEFSATHLPNRLRITRPLIEYAQADERDELWLFGCSYTHGWSVADNENFPWLLQEQFADLNITNFGISGYGTIHSLIQFRDALNQSTPKTAVLVYADFHDRRNTFLRHRRKAIAPWNKLGPLVQPYARFNDEGELQHYLAEVEYEEFPFMRQSASAHYLENLWNDYEQQHHDSRKVSEALILEMAELARDKGVRFVLALIQGDGSILEFASAHGIETADIRIDLSLKAHRNLPHDGHPSALAHKRYAELLRQHLQTDLGRPSTVTIP